ncbi:unnamed protein product [Periconia digitata]|uniref:Uncharacterized protein n=1 Tax=Periconia digitata TaxID=1303443 RepID=A0A9W4U3I0_9PLEO|nr:unnamed protein product [Periconia digitata]
MHLSKFLAYGVFATAAIASPTNLKRSESKPHNKVVGFQEKVPSGLEGDLMKKYKPYLFVQNACVPFPAVNAQGDWSEGLKATGKWDGECGHNKGQVYVRSGWGKDGAWGIMYSWYFPKDMPVHRHDWEEVIVWLESKSLSAKVRGIAFSAHGDYDKETVNIHYKGTRPKVAYFSLGSHQLGYTEKDGGSQPMIAWDSMTEAARKSLTDADFGDASVKFHDKGNQFKNRLDKSFI